LPEICTGHFQLVELKREIKERTRVDEAELDQDSHRLGERIKEFTCLYDI